MLGTSKAEASRRKEAELLPLTSDLQLEFLTMPARSYLLLFGLAVLFCSFWGVNAIKSTPMWPGDEPLTVHVVPHTHDDVGWLKTVDEYYLGANNSIQHAGVQYILDSVLLALQENPERRFIYVEIAFFERWWNEQDEATRVLMKQFVKEGRFEFINGGWCMNDEAATHYEAIIDQMTLGHRFLMETFGVRPRVAWHIDPFGHSAAQAAIFAAMGFDSFMFARIDYQDRALRRAEQRMEMVWRGSASIGEASDIFTSVLYNGYGPLSGFCYDVLCADPPINDDSSLEGNNIKERANLFVKEAVEAAKWYRTNNFLMPFGSDFQFENANENFKNMDKLMAYINANEALYNVKLIYSTPSIYTDAVYASDLSWEVKTDDFFPYADCPHCYWTGYFTSRPAIKGYVRMSNALLHSADSLLALIHTSSRPFSPFESFDWKESLKDIHVLREAMGVAQHHDAVSGTEKQHVADDYARRLHHGASKTHDTFNKMLNSILLKDSAAPVQWTSCEALNISVCPITQQFLHEGDNDDENADSVLVIVIRNSLAMERVETVNVPLSLANVSVYDGNGNVVASQIMSHSDILFPEASQYILTFQAKVPSLGMTTYFINASSATSRGRSAAASMQWESVPVNKPVSLQHGDWELSFDVTGRLSNILNRVNAISLPIQHDILYYNASVGNNLSSQASGAYIFRPNSSEPFEYVPRDQPLSLEIAVGPICSLARLTWVKGEIGETFRLCLSSDAVEVVSHVGPLSINSGEGREVISRFSTNLNADETLYTDANGQEMQKRIYNYRPTWKLNVTEPVAGNYYPLNALSYLQDMDDGRTFTVLTDRSEGVSSIHNGEMEVMIHRRLLVDDARGVGEPLNETGQPNSGDSQEGLIVYPLHLLQIESKESAALHYRTQALRLAHPLQLYFSQQQSADEYRQSCHVEWNVTSDLPANLHILNFRVLSDSEYLLRFTHLFAIGEDAELSKPVTFDMQQLLPTGKWKSCAQYQLSAVEEASKVNRLHWNTDLSADVLAKRSGTQLRESFLITLDPMETVTLICVVETAQ